jgi:ubiquinone/menaquinone biosynthesis C-methylase UbiE
MGEGVVNWHARFTQQARWTEDIRRYLFKRIRLTTGQRLLEVGCGTGAVLSSLAGAGCWIHGLDIDQDFLHQAQQNTRSTCLVQGDAHHLPYASESFDIAYSHFLLLWVFDPARVLSEMRRVVQPGGWVLAMAEPDYGGRIDYPENLIHLGELQEAALSRQGAETRLGRRLAALFHTAGLQEVETGVLGGQWRAAPSLEDLASEWEVLESDLGDRLTPEELARFRNIDAEAWSLGQRVLFVPTFYAIGRK